MTDEVQAATSPPAEGSATAARLRGIGRFLQDLWLIVLFRPVRHGTLDLGPHARGVAGIAWAVAVLYGLVVVSIVLANPLRSVSDLESSISDTAFLVVPTFLLPAVLCLLGISFGLLLAGSQQAPWWRRILYLVVVGGALASVVGICIGLGSSRELAWASAILLGLALLYSIAIWTGRTSASWDGFIMVVLASGILLATYRSLVSQQLLGASSGELVTISLVLTQVATLAIPVAFLSGVNAAALGVSLASWSGEEVGRRSVPVVGAVLVVVVLGWQWVVVVGRLLGGAGGWASGAREVAAATVLLGLCALAWRLCHRGAPAPDTSPVDVAASCVAVAVPVSYGVTAAAFLSALIGALGVSLSLAFSDAVASPFLQLLDIVGSLAFLEGVRVAVVGGLLIGAVVLARRGASILAAVAGIDAIVLATFYWTGRFLPGWEWSPTALGDVGLVIATALAVAWTVRRRWSRERSGFLILLVLLSALVRQADVLAVPLGFLIGASAAALLVVGLVWGFLTDGGQAHEDSPRFPRDRQLLTLLGTFLFAITIVAWAVIGKDVDTSIVLADAGGQAVWTLGSAMVITVVLSALTPRRSLIAGRKP